jgi:uncharacterized protein
LGDRKIWRILMSSHLQWAFLACGAVCPILSIAASFDCATAAAPIEKLICSDDDVSKLDSELGTVLSYLRGVTRGVTNAELVDGQEQWLVEVRNKCNAAQCLRDAYSDRIDSLMQIRTSKATAQYIMNQEERSAQTADFASSLRNFGIPGKLTACDLMVEVMDGRGGRDASFGAICTLGGRAIMICDDTMVGKLTLKLSGFAVTAKQLADFTASNCPRGG